METLDRLVCEFCVAIGEPVPVDAIERSEADRLREDRERWLRRAIHAEELLGCLTEILHDRDDPLALDRMRKRLSDTGPVYDAEFKINRELAALSSNKESE